MEQAPSSRMAGPSNAAKVPICVLVLARDEEANLPDCLHSVIRWVERVVVVVDPRTTDQTREVAARSGAEVYEHPFEDYARQKNWALGKVELRTPWILIVDADERVSAELRAEIQEIIASDGPNAAYAMRFRFIFYGKWIRHCWHSTWIVRLFRTGKAVYETRGVHEHMIVDGELGYLKNDLIHNDFKGMDEWITKHNRYATSEAKAITSPEHEADLESRLLGTRLERRRFLKEKIWNRLPMRPLWLFIYLYFFKFGILDGRLGLRFCLWHSIFEAFVTAKIWEKRLLAKAPLGNYYRQELEQYLAGHPQERAYYE